MNTATFLSPDEIRKNFASAMSEMYQQEVPEYSRLLTLVKQSNKVFLQRHSIELDADESWLLEKERHGAIRVGSANELSTLQKVFRVMGMYPVDYYDLSIAGIPVHSTAFRPLDPKQLLISPFRVFTSLLCIELINDESLRKSAKKILSERRLFTDRLLSLLDKSENQNGLGVDDATNFVTEVLEIFRWHQQANITKEQYNALNDHHRLVADVVSFKGPHINHLTPKVLDIDDIQSKFSEQGFKAKSYVEGPPKRKCDILLRQTSFIALDEVVEFTDGLSGTHTARFGEVEQRGIALTPKGRNLYDQLLNAAKNDTDKSDNKGAQSNEKYKQRLKTAFAAFPDTYEVLRTQQLAYFFYFKTSKPCYLDKEHRSLETLIEHGNITYKPITYEDFLPVSAAGIFTSNLAQGNDVNKRFEQNPNQVSFEEALGSKVINSFELYQAQQQESIDKALSGFC